MLIAGVVLGLAVGAGFALGRGPITEGSPRVSPTPAFATIQPVPIDTQPSDLKIVPQGVKHALDHPVVLAWTPGGLDPSFISRMQQEVPDMVVVRSGLAWLKDSWDADGAKVDHAPGRYAYPLETAAIDPRQYPNFVLPADRWMLADLAEHDRDRVPGVILGATSARLRGVSEGAAFQLQGMRVTVIGVVPDAFVGAHEMVVGLDTGKRLGIDRKRYLLIDPGSLGRTTVTRRIQRASDVPVIVRFPGETPFLRHGDAVQPQVILKEHFGEFAAVPTAGGALRLAPGYEKHLETRRVPLLGTVRCNAAMMPQLIGAMKELQRKSFGHLIHSNDGCFSARFLNRDPGAGISHHTFGVAIDINASENPFGAQPVMDKRIVEVMDRWGFTWGGRWLLPDGMHFEWIGPPDIKR